MKLKRCQSTEHPGHHLNRQLSRQSEQQSAASVPVPARACAGVLGALEMKGGGQEELGGEMGDEWPAGSALTWHIGWRPGSRKSPPGRLAA